MRQIALALGIALTVCLVDAEGLRSGPAPANPGIAPTAKVEPVRQPSTRTYVTSRAKAVGWTGRQMDCLDRLIWAESSWDPTSDNPHSSAYGLFQLLKLKPGTPLPKQVDRGFRYIVHRYGTPCNAWAFHRTHNYY